MSAVPPCAPISSMNQNQIAFSIVSLFPNTMKSSESISRSPTLTRKIRILMIKIRLILQLSLDRLRGDPVPFYPQGPRGHGGQQVWCRGLRVRNTQNKRTAWVNALLKGKMASYWAPKAILRWLFGIFSLLFTFIFSMMIESWIE